MLRVEKVHLMRSFKFDYIQRKEASRVRFLRVQPSAAGFGLGIAQRGWVRTGTPALHSALQGRAGGGGGASTSSGQRVGKKDLLTDVETALNSLKSP